MYQCFSMRLSERQTQAAQDTDMPLLPVHWMRRWNKFALRPLSLFGWHSWKKRQHFCAGVKTISMKLDENERGAQTRLMKVKDMMIRAQVEERRAAKNAEE